MTTWDQGDDSPGRLRGWLLRVALEIGLLGALWVAYDAGRMLGLGRETEARAHAHLVRGVEQFLHLPSEAAIQGALHGLPRVYELANTWYVSMHFPVTVAFLLFGFGFRPREQYVWARNLLIVQTFLALVIHVAFPLAPPRMFPGWGFLDTMERFGPNAYGGASGAVANQFAAMPSLHVGWALLIAVVVVRTLRVRARWLIVLHPTVTVVVVVATANHYWVDAIAAAALLVLTILMVPLPDGPAPAVTLCGRVQAIWARKTSLPVGRVEPSAGSIVSPRASSGRIPSTSASSSPPRPRMPAD